MNKICTSLEQSNKLIELGIDISTADMVYLKSYFEDEEEYSLLVGSYHEGYTEKDDGTIVPVFDEHIPAWSLSALMELIQDDIKIEKTLFDQSDIFTYSIIGDGYEYRSHEHECLLDAAFEFVCWILENKEL